MSIQVTSINGQPYINGKPVYYGETRGRNILINGEVTRVNQRGFDGTSWVDGEYAYDRWKATASEMTQIVEDTDYKYDTTYTLSGDGITTSQITSPSSGDWTIPDVPRTARNIQLEEGSVATPFEQVPIADALARCQRYYQTCDAVVMGVGTAPSGYVSTTCNFFTKMFKVPTVVKVETIFTTANTPSLSDIPANSLTKRAARVRVILSPNNNDNVMAGKYHFDAEL